MFIFFILFSTLVIFLNLNVTSTYINKSFQSKLTTSNVNKIIPNNLVFRFSIFISTLIILYILNTKGYATSVWFNHLNLTNLNFFLFLTFNLIFISIFKLFLNKITVLKKLPFEYFIAIINLNVLLPVLFFSSNILTFFFILEVVSTLILFQFVVGRDWEVLTSAKNTNFFHYNIAQKTNSFINIIFFQYWVSFFSSVLIVYSLLMFIYYFGTTEWVLLNFLTSYDLNCSYKHINASILITYVTFFIGFFLKLGIAPIHFYKIEIYKSLPFVTLIIYTIYFFFIFFLFFTLLVTFMLNNLTIIWFNLGVAFLSIGVLVTASLLFDIYNLKAFFAYSTVVNSMAFLALVISLN